MATTNNSYPISSNSRAKLSAFRYHDEEPTPASVTTKDETKAVHGNKENQSSWLNGVAEPMQTTSDGGNPPPLAASSNEPKSVKECPKTPGNRIPLADLISNAEDSFNPAPGPEVTPVDHVIWQHVPVSSNPDTSSQTPAGRRRKRRHSSSPVGSPSDGSKKVQQEPLDLQSIQALFKTPQHDLATELWNNYMDKNMVDGSEDLPPPRLANLLSSSPQTPASGRTSRDSSGLRRSISCAAEWPTSRTKRRRINRPDLGSGRGIFARTSSNVLDSGKPKSSRINVLLEKIEKSLQPAQPSDMGPSNSSPLRQRVDAQRCRSSSPITDRKGLGDISANADILNASSHGNLGDTKKVALQDSSSDFGDDAFDDQDLMDLANVSEDPFVDKSASRNEFDSFGSSTWSTLAAERPEPGHPKAQPMIDSHQVSEKNPRGTEAKQAIPTEPDDDDEFGDDFDDILAHCDMDQNNADPLKLTAGGHQTSTFDRSVTREHDKKVPSQAQDLPAHDAEGFSSGDEFDDDFDLEAIEQTMKQTGEDEAYDPKSRQAIKRHQVVDLAEGFYVTSKGRTQPEQVLSVEDEKTKTRKVIILRESWCDTPCSKDSFISLVGKFDSFGQCIVDNAHNMVILHPDHLISATVVADSIDCRRRAVLQDRVKVFGELGKPQVFGTLFHEVFQEALKANQWDTAFLRSLTETVLQRHVEELYAIQMSIPEAVEELMGKIPSVQAWADTLLHTKPKANSFVEDRHSSKLNLSISKLLEVEEHIWSPRYGLKGNIDATVQVACRDNDVEKNLVIPLELKTGKRDTSQAHRAQTALYTLLLSDRYDVEVAFGLLYYLEVTRTISIRGIRHELLQMVQMRNHLAGYIRERNQLPPMLKKARMCNRCYAKTPCLIYHKLSEDGDGETSALGDDFDVATGHLNEKDREFFKKWDELLTIEEGNLVKFRRELWTLLSDEREALGRCFGGVVVDPRTTFEENSGTKINRYRYTFVKRQAPPNFSFAESQISVGEPVVVSDEKGHFALANGYVLSLSASHVTVGVDRKLHDARSRTIGFDEVTNQSFRGIMEIGNNHPLALENPGEQVTYRIDKDEFSNGMAIVRNNLICMMDKDLFQARQLRRLVVEGQAPVFKPSSSAYTIADAGSLNVDQRQAIEKVMSAKDYALVLGMPGTGKTTTISHIIRALVAQGKSVLLTSYTHTAVDNILLKIRDDNIHILRLGATSKIHPEVQEFADLAATPKTTIEELKVSYEKPQVVATTCLSVNHQIFNQRIFDYCIVDEASQITLPVCLGPIQQGGPRGGLDVSLFKLLSDTQPDSVVNLEHQYRMCDEIMLLSNSLIYSGRLKCGTPEVAARSLEIPNLHALQQFHAGHISSSQSPQEICGGVAQGRCWIQDVLQPSAKTLLVNTDPLGAAALETSLGKGQRVVSHMETVLCSQIVEAFIACGIPARNIGVITFYRSQLALLRQALRHHAPDLEMHTTDKFQGRDKEVVILSCVRSNSENHVGDLLRDWRRLNVAFTRARTKLLVVGSHSTLRNGNEILEKYVSLVDNKGWVYHLPPGAADSHVFPSSVMESSQMTGSAKSKPSPRAHKRISREPLSPLGSRQSGSTPRKPAKVGAKLLNGTTVLGNRPILQDLVNDVTG
ncbi:hypothetical protein N7492_001250 [Penicillium capsulatum]|uniref:DNA replication ATP-dependent helicase/nuclease n=1 Tax=Penicillium capsulatum TaxID=69766 RepID=A0A9W9ITB8_9EURO|nr:hypothetical protein N7492_001250 [Penicillium capsulatum]KAJ6129692.1 hypothetical protein N7512_002472 [Penicillium capsulatum]